VRIVPAGSLDDAARLQAAEHARIALEAYYAGLPEDRARQLIAGGFTEPGDELGDALAALDGDDRPVGIAAGYPLDQLRARQQAGLYRSLGALSSDEVPGFVAGARALSAHVPAVEGTGLYLARLGVGPSARGTGVADELLAAFAASGTGDIVLHVHRDNAPALAFYRRRGFAVTDDALPYLVMRRSAGA